MDRNPSTERALFSNSYFNLILIKLILQLNLVSLILIKSQFFQQKIQPKSFLFLHRLLLWIDVLYNSYVLIREILVPPSHHVKVLKTLGIDDGICRKIWEHCFKPQTIHYPEIFLHRWFHPFKEIIFSDCVSMNWEIVTMCLLRCVVGSELSILIA